MFDVAEEFAASHRQGLLVAIHRNKVADAYIVLLFDDYAVVKDRLDAVMRSVSFAPRPVVPAGTPSTTG